jgi:dephospho-CoA kinase
MKHALKNMPIIGLTGGIGMGKSAVADLLGAENFPIYFADKAVHALLDKGGKAIKPVAKLFPASFREGAIDRKRLGYIVFNQPRKLKKLEKILHPLVRKAEKQFLSHARHTKAAAAILEIPLLFETGSEKRCDYVICVTASRAVQEARVMHRPGMTREKLKAIRARQMSDAQRRKRADFVIDTSGSRAATKKQLQRVLKAILKK